MEAARMEQVRLAELVASKLCHDIMGPMTAMMHGVELLKQGDVSDPEAFSLLENGVAKAHAKLDFYRHALGGALAGDGVSSVSAARAAAEGLYATFKASLDWRAPEISAPRPFVRITLNLLLIANDCLPKGGVVTLAAGNDSLRILAVGERARLRPDIAAALNGEFTEEGVALNVQPLLTAIMARQAGAEIAMEAEGARVAFTLKGAPFLGLVEQS
ncbi:MAG: histidine phosphotransferase family protein [Hyphomonadaceae bacterium]